MAANMITLSRIILVFVTVGLFQLNNVYVSGLATLMVLFVIYLDSLDGYVARKLKSASSFGALFDITGDRIVENVFWIYFAVAGMLPSWIPMLVITRGFLTDTVRAVAFKDGKTPFGENTMMKTGLTRFLVASRFSRGFYGGLKVIVFSFLGFLVFLNTGIAEFGWSLGTTVPLLNLIKDILVYLTVFMCIARGMPVLWDGKEMLFKKVGPTEKVGCS